MPVFTSAIEVTADYPTIKPSLNFNFARSRALDPRITFTRSSVGTYVGRDGLIKTAGENEPRFDHDPDTLESLGLLLEESRTNLITNSALPLSAAGGNLTSSNLTVSVASSTVSPDGTTDGVFRYTSGPGSAAYRLGSAGGGVAQATYTGSIWARAVSGTASFNLDINDTTAAGYTVDENWRRFTVSGARSDASAYMFMDVNASPNNDLYFWGPQLEQSTFESSYIKTTGSAVTRADDFGYITGANFSSWFNQSEGSLDVGYRLGYDNVGMRVCQINNNNANNVIDLVVGSGGGIGGYWFINTGGTTQFSSSGVTNSSQVGAARNFRAVLAYKENDVAAQQDKVSTITTDTNVTLANNYDRLLFYQIANGGDQIQGHLKYIRYYPKRITNAQVTQLSQDDF